MEQPKLSVLKNANGSCEIEQNGFKVVCGVNGPMEARPRQELPTSSYLEVIIRPDSGLASMREKMMEDKIKSFLDSVIIGNLYPRQVIQVNLQILQKPKDDENYQDEMDVSRKVANVYPELSICVNAAYLALVDANISIHMAFNALLFAYTKEGKLAPFEGDVLDKKSIHLCVYGIKDEAVDRLLLSENAGDFNEDKLYNVLDEGEKEALVINQRFRELIESNLRSKFVFLN